MKLKFKKWIGSAVLVVLFAPIFSYSQANQNTPLKLPDNTKVSHKPTPAPEWQLHNRLSRNEKTDGYILLFDGKTTSGWRGYNQTAFPSNWVVDNGTLRTADLSKSKDKREDVQRDIVYSRRYGNFVLKLEWKTSLKGNSGIYYLVQESSKDNRHYSIRGNAPQMQISDDTKSVDNKNAGNAGSLVGLIPVSHANTKPVGQWNDIEIHVKDRNVVHYQNGEILVKYQLDSPTLKALMKNSEFSDNSQNWENVPVSGLIGLKDQGHAVWFRNIKLKPL